MIVLFMALVTAIGCTWVLQVMDPRTCSAAGLGRVLPVPFVAPVPAGSGDSLPEGTWREVIDLAVKTAGGPRVLALLPADPRVDIRDVALGFAGAAQARGVSTLLAGCGPGIVDGWPGLAEICSDRNRDSRDPGCGSARRLSARMPIESVLIPARGRMEERVIERRGEFDVMPAGDWTRSAGLSFSHDRLAECLRWIRARYDLAILACRSADEYPEILSAASVTDGALLVVRGGRTRLAGLGSLHGSLTRIGCPIAGILWVAGAATPARVESVEEVAA